MLNPNLIFDIEEQRIISKKQCVCTLNFADYYDNIVQTNEYFIVPGILSFYIPDEDDYTQIILNYPVKLYKTINIEIDGKNNIITYEKGDIVVTQEFYSGGFDINTLIKTVQGRIKYINDPIIMLNMLHNILPNIDLIHIELVLSNMFREKDDNSKLCRFGGNYKDVEILGQSKQASVDSWESAMSYRNMGRGIEKGLIEGKPSQNNPIEKILNEEFD
jgi:hypothetical protein